MRRLRIASVFVGVLALALLGASAATAIGGQMFAADLDGTSEVPGPGDPDGSGSATVTVNRGQGEVCWWVEVRGIEQATAAHIHVGDAGVAGPVVVGLTPPGSDGTSTGCATVERDLAKAIGKDPWSYYVNVHTPTYPAGALRGQLG